MFTWGRGCPGLAAPVGVAYNAVRMARNVPNYAALEPHFPKWEKVGDMVDQCIDLMLNLRQSGHPGG